MKSNEYTNTQLVMQWLIRELLENYSQTGSLALVHEFLDSMEGFERHSLLQLLFWVALDRSDWSLAEACVEEGYPIRPSDDDQADGGPLFDVISGLGDRAKVVEWLLDHGAQVDRRGWLDHTPLMAAASEGFDATVNVLLLYGANVNSRSDIDGGWSALAAAASRGHQSTARLLLEHGADPNLLIENGRDAAALAEAGGHHELARFLRAERLRWHRSEIGDI